MANPTHDEWKLLQPQIHERSRAIFFEAWAELPGLDRDGQFAAAMMALVRSVALTIMTQNVTDDEKAMACGMVHAQLAEYLGVLPK